MNFFRTMPKDKLQRLVLATLVALTIFGGVLQFYVLKQVRELNGFREQLKTLQGQIQEAETSARQVAQAEQVRAQTRAFVETQERTMIAGDPFAWTVREISLVAERHPIRVLSWRPGGKGQHGQKSGYAVFAIRLDLVGRYDELGQFIKDLENRFPQGAVRLLEMSAGADGGGAHLASLDFTLLLRPAETPSKVKEGTHS